MHDKCCRDLRIDVGQKRGATWATWLAGLVGKEGDELGKEGDEVGKEGDDVGKMGDEEGKMGGRLKVSELWPSPCA